MLDACNGAQLESLVRLTDSAGVAVASEHTVRGYGFPLDRMFDDGAFPAGARAMGAELVESAHHQQPSRSLVAVDLQQLQHELLPALDRLGPALLRWPERKAVRNALQQSMDPGGGLFHRKYDLGSFLANLNAIPGLRQHCPELSEAEADFNRTIVAMAGHGTISFDLHEEREIPEGWRSFLKHV